MDPLLEYAVSQLGQNAATIRGLTQAVSGIEARRRPDPDAWSMLEVINHLLDEEREDFRPRLDILLQAPEQRWAPIDPAGWVVSRGYNERALAHSLAAFSRAREQSLAWLASLTAPDWQASYQAEWGVITAGEMLAAWVAHDLLHTRQLVEIRWALTVAALQPHAVKYAGDW